MKCMQEKVKILKDRRSNLYTKHFFKKMVVVYIELEQELHRIEGKIQIIQSVSLNKYLDVSSIE